MSIIKTSFKSFLFNILGAGLAFIFQILAAKYLGGETYGQANYYIGYSTTIAIFTSFGLQTYLSKKIPEVNNKNELFSEVITTYTLFFIATQIIIFILLRRSDIDLFNYFTINILAYLTSLSDIILSYNASMGNATKGMFYRKFLYSGLNLTLFLPICMLTLKRYYIYIFIMIISYVVTCTPFLVENISRIKVNLTILKQSMSFYGVQIIYGVYFSYSKVLQKHYGTFETVAVLSVSLTIGGLVSMLGDNFTKVSMPEFSKAWSEKNIDKLKEIYMTISRMNCFLILPIAIVLIINANRILNLLGKEYSGGKIIFILVMISQFVNSFTGPNGTVLVMTKYTNLEIFNGGVKLIVSILVVFFWGYEIIWAVALSLALSEIVVNILKFIEVKIRLNIVPYTVKDLTYIIVLAIFEFIILNCISKVSNLILWIMCNGIAIAIVYLITFMLSPNKVDKSFINNIRLRLKLS